MGFLQQWKGFCYCSYVLRLFFLHLLLPLAREKVSWLPHWLGQNRRLEGPTCICLESGNQSHLDIECMGSKKHCPVTVTAQMAKWNKNTKGPPGQNLKKSFSYWKKWGSSVIACNGLHMTILTTWNMFMTKAFDVLIGEPFQDFTATSKVGSHWMENLSELILCRKAMLRKVKVYMA